MQVSELSTELGVPVSAVLEGCERLGIDATSADSEVGAIDASRLRADPALAHTPELPPTAVGSLPGLVEAKRPIPSLTEPNPGAGAGQPHKRTFDRRAGSAATLVGVALVALLVGNQLINIWTIVGLWLVAGVCLFSALVAGRRSWRRARVHGDRYWGCWLAPLSMLVALAALVGLGTAIYTAAGDEPATDAPLGIGDFVSVQRVRWGYQRTQLLRGNGWTQPVKVAGSCWLLSERERDLDNRPAERIEVGNVGVSCDRPHTIEVLDAFNINRDADVPYPGADALVADGQEQCADELEEVLANLGADQADQVSMLIEIPTEQGWDDADHSVACVAVTPERTSALLSGG